MDYLRHASACRACSLMLAEALALGTAEPSSEEEAMLASLETSSEAGRQRLVARMQQGAQPQPVRTAAIAFPRKRYLWPVLTFFAAAAIAAIAFVLIPHFRQPSDAQLIAEAYDRHRPTELRIPGANAVPLYSPTRGANSSPETSTELLQVKLRAQQQFEKTPNDPGLRETLGEIALVDHDGETARRQFEMAEALNARLPRLKFDLASAYFELAESSADPLDYARAIDLFSQSLQANPNDPVALFDRGLCWERQSVNTEAIKDFEAALAVEKDPGWRAEIQRHLDKLKAQSAGATAAPAPLTPESLLALRSESPGDYENFLDVAGREWLPNRAQSPVTASALEKLAAMGAAHDDLWLRDLLAAPPNLAADQALARALQSNARGDPDSAIAAAATAAQIYPHDSAGLLRARTEHVYALQRMGHSPECLSEAQSLLATPSLAHYAWMRTQLQLEIGSCSLLEGTTNSAEKATELGAAIAQQTRLPIIGLRASGFLVYCRSEQGKLAAAWQSTTASLAESYAIRGTSMRRYQFLDSSGRIAAVLHLPWTEAGLADAAAADAQRTGNDQVTAYAFETLGMRQLGIGASSAASQSFAAADKQLDRLGHGPSAALYRATWQTERSELLARQQNPAAAVTALAGGEDKFQYGKTLNDELRFYAQYADLLRRAQRPQESEDKAWYAVRASEQLLAGIHSEAQRQAWQQQTSRAYLVLIRDMIEAGQAETALRTWEWFHGAAFRDAAHLELAATNLGATLPPFPAVEAPGRLTLVYARLEDEYVAWSISRDLREHIRMVVLPAKPESIDQESAAFRRLCSDPNSSLQDIALLGNALDRDLLSPFASQITSAQSLQLDLDPSLAALPFAAIPTAGGPARHRAPAPLSPRRLDIQPRAESRSSGHTPRRRPHPRRAPVRHLRCRNPGRVRRVV